METVNNPLNRPSHTLAKALQQAAQHLHTQLNPLPELLGDFTRRVTLALPHLIQQPPFDSHQA